ncbi:toll/interleukin-1 receptor domain-containing protein [Nocardiopsis suaedae]|uniref:Toll/interleukin-1 receptor domain-containing protein n=1 Tax=Nocardiopsis suaedae TaxID=3018444 RepID=A0ABT4TFA1_9ACTN|nr:toll/interleukin-1 receptor domain-containing protein [Nocardiopsis suaedae]MDA2803031.1 toll/interleukin-1 receptor domain-containing protein [Nocardiopsis suaedae]
MSDIKYDIAVSFAGEQRGYVARFVEACKALGVSVFYDRDLTNEWWGNSFIREQRKVYGAKTRYFVPFISTEYLSKPIPQDEFSAAMMAAVNQGDSYVLPVLWGDVQVPADLLHPHIHYLKAGDYTPERLADAVAQRIGIYPQQAVREVGEVVREAMQYRMPKVVPQEFSKYRELNIAFDYLAEQLSSAVRQLEDAGFIGTVNRTDSMIMLRVELQGHTVYSLDITKGGPFGDDKLNFVVGGNHINTHGNSSNGHAAPFFDRDTQMSKLRMFDLSVFCSMGGQDKEYTKEEFFDALWDRIIDQLERLT